MAEPSHGAWGSEVINACIYTDLVAESVSACIYTDYIGQDFRFLDAAGGTYTLTGTDAGLFKHYYLNASPGYYTYSGADASLGQVFSWNDITLKGVDAITGRVVYIIGAMRSR